MLGEVRNALPVRQPADESNPLVEASFYWETYALAVQVFAGMTVDALLNTYGLVRFGGGGVQPTLPQTRACGSSEDDDGVGAMCHARRH